MNDTKSYVDSLFSSYEETKELADFKEELTGNLNDKIASLVRKGLGEDEAFKKAAAELGGISALADDISLKKKQEVIGEAYMDIRRYLKPGRVAAYVLCGFLLAFGAVTAAIAWFAVRNYDEPGRDFPSLFGTLVAFIPLAAAGFTWLGLTQELPALYPLPKKRAAWYAAGTFLLSAGILLVPLTYFSTGGKDSAISALAVLIPFALPAVSLLAFLGLTEKDRRKPWLARGRGAVPFEELFASPAAEARFGLLSGAIWLGAFALFILAGFLAGFKYSWMSFLFAVPAQLCVQAAMMKDGGKKPA